MRTESFETSRVVMKIKIVDISRYILVEDEFYDKQNALFRLNVLNTFSNVLCFKLIKVTTN